MLYLVHLDPPYQHAGHYLGFCDTKVRDPEVALDTRISFHRAGRGSRLLAVAAKAGSEFVVARIWPTGTRSDERRLKGHSSTRLCPLCSGPAAMARGVLNLSGGS